MGESLFDRLYTYNNTFTDNNLKQKLKPPQDPSFTLVENVEDCEIQALKNVAPFFALTDFNNNTNKAKCLIADNIYDIKQSTNLINDAQQCLDYVYPDTCYFTNNNGENFGIGNNFSIYTSPRLTINMLERDDTGIIIRENINQYLNDTREILSEFLEARGKYLDFYFLNVEIDLSDTDVTGVERFFREGTQRDEFLELKRNMETSQTSLENAMNSLNDNFNNLLQVTQGLNERFRILSILVGILNSKIIIAEKFFNVLMSKNQGAIGELDLTEYNRNLSIFENVVLSIIMSTAIYLYFKK